MRVNTVVSSGFTQVSKSSLYVLIIPPRVRGLFLVIAGALSSVPQNVGLQESKPKSKEKGTKPIFTEVVLLFSFTPF